jgi:ABC-type multidrug transport system fused ATPase/permease subunit
VGSEGVKLSGGQRQKLAIARVVLKNSKVFLFDEATSALDNASQQRIEKLRMTKWRGTKTVIAVVHRLDMIAGYDKIAVMQNGRLVEFGPYEELMAKSGFLHNLVAEKT